MLFFMTQSSTRIFKPTVTFVTKNQFFYYAPIYISPYEA